MRARITPPPGPVGPRPGAGLFGVLATVLLVLVVVGAEFLLLFAVYHRGDDVRAQHVAAARLDGIVQGPLTAPTLAAADLALRQVRSAGVPAGRTSAIAAVLHRPGVAPGAVRAETRRLSRDLAAESGRVDDQASMVYVVLLVVVSLGWMVWFRRLVARHKDLQRRITEQDARLAGEQRLAALVHNSRDVIAVLDADSCVTFAAPSVAAVLGWQPDELVGRTWIDEVLLPAEVPAFVHALATCRADTAVAMQGRRRDGRPLHLEGTLTNLLGDDSVDGFVLTVRDVTARREMEEQLTHRAFHDALTGLANRRLFADRLEHAMRRRSGDGESGAVVLFFDLDDFKQINDSVGHGVGDEVLIEVAARLDAVLRPEDTAARLGGDEFAVLMEQADLPAARGVAERLQTALREPIVVDGRPHAVTASIGLALAGDGATWEEVLRNADVAMYLAKDRGKAGVAVYEAALHAESLERMQVRADLQRALRNDEFVLYYQPAVDLRSRRVIGFEALVRWQRPGHGLVGPVHFIPEAERSGLIVPLGSWVLRQACVAAAAMQAGGDGPSMSVNVAVEQLTRDEFVDEVLGVLRDTGLAADRLCLEITESTLMRDLHKIVERLERLRARGIRVAVDDFGTGYSSLSYLSTLPVDVLKVDRSFVERVTHSEQDASVTQAIIAMSRAMRLTTVAEGIEDDGQANWLASANCAVGQGFLWSRPVPLGEARQMLSATTWASTDTALPLRPVEDGAAARELADLAGVPVQAQDARAS